jgi:hypothetical protein
MPAVVTGDSPSAATVTGPGGNTPPEVSTSVSGSAVRVILLDAGVSVPPPNTPVPSLIVQKES